MKAVKGTREKSTKSKPKQIGVFPNATSAKRFRFKISNYGIKRKHKKIYSYKCQIKDCPEKFDNVTDWNQHHRSKHPRVTYKCEKCGRISTSPIQHQDHVYLHKETQITCGRCYSSFPNVSHLNIHRHLHKRQRLYNCFSPNCKRGYKWPQDLLLHIKRHLPISHKFPKCNYSTPEKRLFK